MIHSFTITFGAKYLTGMVTSVPPYEIFSLIKHNILHVLSRNMFPTTRNLQIRVHVFSSSPLLWRLINFWLFCSDDCRSLYLVKKMLVR
jgi:hypothetical protein